ncbi:MAG: arsenite methyltransferase [Anaerolineae bacterium]|nr:arsenite methyltransferase [Anaerolineae bacterium]
MSQNDQIRDAVQERYGAIARSLDVVQPAAASCCGDAPAADKAAAADCGCSSKLYADALLENLPADAVNLSLGCGDPVTIANLNPGETVLDLGSGGGIDCFMAAQQVGETGYVIGVDMTPDMLAKANASKARMGVSNVEFREGHIEALPVDDDSIDVIMSNCVINLSPDKIAVFHEAFRVLKPGGRVSISDIVTEGEFSTEARAEMDQWAACVTGAIDVEEYTGMMREAGFVDIEVVDKASTDEIVGHTPGMPRVYSARITARKPA